MFKIVVLMVLFCSCNLVYADYVTTTGLAPNYTGFQSKLRMNQPNSTIATHRYPRRNSYRRNYLPRYNSNVIPTGSLNALERYALKKNYARESNIQRLERLEDLAFGAAQEGDYETRYNNVESAILSRPQNQYKKSFFNNLANYFIGQSTGLTPSIAPGLSPYYMGNSPVFNNYMQPPQNFFDNGGFNNSNYESYSNGIFGRGYGIRNNSFNSGSSIRILD